MKRICRFKGNCGNKNVSRLKEGGHCTDAHAWSICSYGGAKPTPLSKLSFGGFPRCDSIKHSSMH